VRSAAEGLDAQQYTNSTMVRVSVLAVVMATTVGSLTTIQKCQGFHPSLGAVGAASTPSSSLSSRTSSRMLSLSMRQNPNSDDLSSIFFYQNDDRNNLDRILGSSGGGSSSSSDNTQNAFPFESLSTYNEYDRDAEFYRRRNQEYFKSLEAMQQQATYSFNDLTANEAQPKTSQQRRSSSPPDAQKMAEDTINSVLKTSRSSFKNVEKLTFRLLNRRPLVALAIFLATGALLAYVTGFFILEGYIDNLNPAENDQVPYWDEPEIHTIMRKP
jgi:hypothetical protein